jgi:hypothetical protein
MKNIFFVFVRKSGNKIIWSQQHARYFVNEKAAYRVQLRIYKNWREKKVFLCRLRTI